MLFGVVERRFVAVVAVGNDELFVGHGACEQADYGRIADTPYAVQDVVLVGGFSISGARRLRRGSSPRCRRGRSRA